jgi:hypothetical protein
MSDRTIHRRPRRTATLAQRLLVREVANFVRPRVEAGECWLQTFALISRQFPNIRLDDALCGYVFRDAIVAMPPDKILRDLPAEGNA